MLDKIVEQSAEALNYMHTKKWIHLDVKPDNFLVSSEGTVKLIDFTIAQKKKTGLSKLFHSVKVAKGTRSYMALNKFVERFVMSTRCVRLRLRSL